MLVSKDNIVIKVSVSFLFLDIHYLNLNNKIVTFQLMGMTQFVIHFVESLVWFDAF